MRAFRFEAKWILDEEGILVVEGAGDGSIVEVYPLKKV